MNGKPGASFLVFIRTLMIFTGLIMISVSSLPCLAREPVEYVNPFIGTGGHGHTFPGACVPFGMVQLSPDTGISGWDHCSGYHYPDNGIMGFSLTHLSGTGCADYGDILLMPTTGKLKLTPVTPGSRFSHEDEQASAGYYAVILQTYNIKVELTATRRAGFLRFTFPKSSETHILIDLAHGIGNSPVQAYVKVVGGNQIEGYRRSKGWARDRTVYFVAEFSKPFSSYGTWEETWRRWIHRDQSEESGKKVGAYVGYSASQSRVIMVKVGISFVSVDGARRNLEVEIPDWDFERVRREAKETWNEELNKIEVEGGTDDQKVIFYTALYHCLLCPYVFSDVDGKYIGMDGRIHTAKDHTHYSVFSLWDTFRAEMPLLTLIQPERLKDMISSLVAKYKEGGWLPIWPLANNYTNCMIGDHAVPVIVDAYMKGIRNFEVEKAYEAMRKGAMETPPQGHPFRGRVGLEYYKEMGYIPADKVDQSVSRTLEYAYDDWCLAQMARVLGKDDDYNIFLKRAHYYENVFDTSGQFMRPRNMDGSWVEPFDPMEAGNRYYTEANAWQYTWSVPHDVEGLIELMGGAEKFIKKLDALFEQSPEVKGPPDITGLIGQYAHGNEPSHHIAYLYNYAGAPWKTQERVRQIMDGLYGPGPQGLCGNEDCGQISAWYVFSAMGFYPVCPGQGMYVIGSPIFERVTIHLNRPYKADKFIIKANNVSSEDKYIQSAVFNGKALKKPWIRHSDITAGGTLTFEMGPEPNTEWGGAPEGPALYEREGCEEVRKKYVKSI